MHVERYGSGPRVFLALHGWIGGQHSFAALLPYVPADASVFVADLPGFGRSAAPAEWSINALDEALCEVYDALPAGEFTLVGYCTGSLLGLHAGLRRQERFKRFVMIDPFAFMPTYFRIFLWGDFGRWAYWSTFANPLGRMITNGALRRHRTNQTDLTGGFSRVDTRVAYEYLKLFGALPTVEVLRGFDRPTTLVCGVKTFKAVKQSLPQWREVWPHAQTVMLENAGHAVIDEAPQRLAEIIFEGESGEASCATSGDDIVLPTLSPTAAPRAGAQR